MSDTLNVKDLIPIIQEFHFGVTLDSISTVYRLLTYERNEVERQVPSIDTMESVTMDVISYGKYAFGYHPETGRLAIGWDEEVYGNATY